MSELSLRRRWIVVLVATSTMAVSYVDRQTFSVLGPRVTEFLHINDTEYGWLASAFSIAYLVGTPLGGRLIGVLGVRRGLLGSVLVWSGVAALHAVAPTYAAYFALRIALGLAESPAFPGGAFTVHRSLLDADRARGMGILFAGSSVGAMLVPTLVTTITKHADWRLAFLGTAVVGLSWVPVWLWASGGAARQLLERAPAEERSASTSIDWMELLRRPALRRAIAVVLCAAPSGAMALLFGAKYLVRTFHLGQNDLGPYLTLPAVMYDVGSVAIGDWASRRAKAGRTGIRDLIALGALLTASVGLLGWAPSAWVGSALMGLSLAGVAGLFTLVTSRALSGVLPAEVPVAGGILAATQSLAYIVASPLIGRSVDWTGSYRTAGLALALTIIPGALLWAMTDSPSSAPAPTPPY